MCPLKVIDKVEVFLLLTASSCPLILNICAQSIVVGDQSQLIVLVLCGVFTDMQCCLNQRILEDISLALGAMQHLLLGIYVTAHIFQDFSLFA
jgi:hypothetical protein